MQDTEKKIVERHIALNGLANSPHLKPALLGLFFFFLGCYFITSPLLRAVGSSGSYDWILFSTGFVPANWLILFPIIFSPLAFIAEDYFFQQPYTPKQKRILTIQFIVILILVALSVLMKLIYLFITKEFYFTFFLLTAFEFVCLVWAFKKMRSADNN